MPGPDLKAYLAEKYMSGPKADAILAKTASQTKKKRKKATTPGSTDTPGGSNAGVKLVDEDAGWPQESRDVEDEDDFKDALVASDRGFKKRKTDKGESSWVTVQEGAAGPSGVSQEDEEPTPTDEQPQVVAAPFVGGLVTAKQLKKVVPQRAEETTEYTEEEIAQAQETVYRDASGKKIDMKMAKAEAARLKREREEKEAQKMEWGKGLVQRDEREQRRKEMEKNKAKPFARGIEDKDMNEELKSKELWNDPAAMFMTVSVLHTTAAIPG
jgi:pre-mRNA-splicing factor CWC26